MCNHRCKNKNTYGIPIKKPRVRKTNNIKRCNHFCCRNGLDRPPKRAPKQAPKEQAGSINNIQSRPTSSVGKSSGLPASQKSTPKSKQQTRKQINIIDLTGPPTKVIPVPHSKYVKKRNDNEDKLRKLAPHMKEWAPSAGTARFCSLQDFEYLPSLDFSPEDKKKQDENNSSDFGSIDINDWFASRATLDPIVLDESDRGPMPLSCKPMGDFDYDDNLDGDIVVPRHESSENVLTDFEEYDSSIDMTSPLVYSEAGAKFPNTPSRGERLSSQQTSPHGSSIFSMLLPAADTGLLPANTTTSSDSLFFQSPAQSKPKNCSRRKTRKRGCDKIDKESQYRAKSDAKKLRLDPSGIPATVPGWEGIDPALIEQFKDVADFI